MTKAKSHSTCDPRVFNSEQAIDTNGRQATSSNSNPKELWDTRLRLGSRLLLNLVKFPHPQDLVTSNLSLLPPVGKEIQPNALWMPSPPTLGYNIDWCISLNSAVNKVDFQL